MKTTAAATILAGSLAGVASAIQPVSVKGNAFFAGNERFYIRGVDYQPGGDAAGKDPIADVAGCKRDLAYFKKLGINTVRVYTVDNTANHDQCMSMLADAGIYLALDVNNKAYSINRADPAPSYNDVYLQSVFATIDAFVKYDNTLLFYSANEVINSDNTTSCAPYVKAVNRDMRGYIRARNYRTVPVGYSAADVEDNRFEMASYMNCGDEAERADFHAFNDYSFCDPSSFVQSGWAAKVQQYSDYSIPLFLSEYGCIKGVRKFEEVASLYSPNMTHVYSGGLAYEYSNEASNYGLVTLSGNTVTLRQPDFSAYETALANTPSPSGDGGYKTNGTPSQCPPKSATWDVDTDELPAMPALAEKYMKSGAGKGPGLGGAGSQNAGTASTGFAKSGAPGNPSTDTQDNNSGSSSSSKSDSAATTVKPSFVTAGCSAALLLLVTFSYSVTLL